jgi:hypothetical protein
MEYQPGRQHQRFCSDKCRHTCHNREKLGGVILTPTIKEQLRSLAEAHGMSINEMACRILHQSMNPDGRPLDDKDIFGK